MSADHQKLLRDNIALVHHFAKKFKSWAARDGIEYEDFVADLLACLAEQIPMRFDPNRGTYSTFAWQVMRTRLLLYRSQTSTDMRDLKGRKLTELGPDKLYQGKNLARLDLVDAADELAARWHVLDDRERHVLRGRFWEGRKLRDLAAELKLTRERVRQIQNTAIEKLRAA